MYTLNHRLLPVITFLISIICGILYYEKSSNLDLKENFSSNLEKWFNKGSYFAYKDAYKLFYVHESLTTENEYSDSGEDLPTLLFLHGFPTSSYDFTKIWNLFRNEKKFKSILTFDYIGYGFSDKPKDYEYNIFDMADMVDMLLLHLNIRSVFLVSHDVGDTVAQELIRRENLNNQNHFRIEKIILLNGGIITGIYQPLFAQEILRIKLIKKTFSKYFFRFFVFKFIFKNTFGSLNQPSERDFYDYYLAIKYNRGNDILPQTIEYMSEREQYGDVWYDALNETRIPVMFIYGPADPINPRSKFPQRIRTDLPNVTLSILSDLVGHYPHVEDPFTVSELIKKFF